MIIHLFDALLNGYNPEVYHGIPVYPIFYEPTVPSLSKHVKVINWIGLAAFFWWQESIKSSLRSDFADKHFMPSTIRNDGLSMKNRWDMLIQPSIVGIYCNQWIVGNWGNDDSPINFEVLHLPHGFGLRRFHLAPFAAALCFTLFHQQFPSVEWSKKMLWYLYNGSWCIIYINLW